jgi:GNAT superfamily N-acetyltransferase
MCSITIGFSTINCKNVGIFEDFFIQPEYRGKGVARQLTAYVFFSMEKYNVKTVWVGCVDIDLEMYKYLGFDIPLGNLLAWSKA